VKARRKGHVYNYKFINNMEEEKFKKLKGYYGRLIAIKSTLRDDTDIREEIVGDINKIIKYIESTTDENIDDLMIPESVKEYWENLGIYKYDQEIVNSKVTQLINLLEYNYNLNETIKEIGSLVNAIKDQDLRDRCFDLLSASSNFDRVINQATLILEDRIRVKSQVKDKLEGVKLVNKVLNPDLSKTILKVSNDEDEHKGICDLCRGVMSSFRNSTHHHLTDKFSREDALKFCGFIDILLNIIDNSTIIKNFGFPPARE